MTKRQYLLPLNRETVTVVTVVGEAMYRGETKGLSLTGFINDPSLNHQSRMKYSCDESVNDFILFHYHLTVRLCRKTKRVAIIK